MKKYYIVAESGADLSPELIEKHDIRIAPMHVALDSNDYLDGALSLDDLCDFYDTTGKIPKTSAVAPFEYSEIFNKIKSENPNAIIIHVGYSKQLSSSFQNALIASDEFNQIYHVDSYNVSLGHARVVMRAVDLIEKNPDITADELVEDLKEYAKKVQFWFIPGNLKYLRAGGRVSNTKSLIATILKIKPVLKLVDGKMFATKNYRGSFSKIILNMLEDFFSKRQIELDTIFVGYTHTIDEILKKAMYKLIKTFGVKNVLWFKAGSVITSHAGPGGIGIAGITI